MLLSRSVFTVAFSFLFFATLPATQLNLSSSAQSAILINAHTGAVLYEKKPHDLHYPASITKVATALYALKSQWPNVDVLVTAEQESVAAISSRVKKRSNYKTMPYWIELGSSHIGIKTGETLPFRSLLYGMLVASGNDAANVLAQYVGGTIPNFMNEMNAHLKEIGCQETHFLNPHGLHHPDHQTSAHDMALITQEAMKNSLFCDIVSTKSYTRPATNKQPATQLIQTNHLIRPGPFFYPKAIGVKTGYTSDAKHTLVAAARQGERTLIAVLLHCEERGDTFREAAKMFEAAFNEAKASKCLLKEGPQKYALQVDGGKRPVSTYLKEDVIIDYYPSEESPLKGMLQWDALTVPVAKDQHVGEIQLTDTCGIVVRTIPLFAVEEVQPTFFFAMKEFFGNLNSPFTWVKIILGIVIVVAVIGLVLRLRSRK